MGWSLPALLRSCSNSTFPTTNEHLSPLNWDFSSWTCSGRGHASFSGTVTRGVPGTPLLSGGLRRFSEVKSDCHGRLVSDEANTVGCSGRLLSWDDHRGVDRRPGLFHGAATRHLDEFVGAGGGSFLPTSAAMDQLLDERSAERVLTLTRRRV
jgi:hypothetical protein